MLCAAYTFLKNEHIRIDIVNSRLPKRVRDWIDLLGHFLFLMPFVILMIVDGIPFFTTSWYQNEQSLNAGGLPQWPAKFLIPLGFFLLFLQGVSEIIKRIAVDARADRGPARRGAGPHRGDHGQGDGRDAPGPGGLRWKRS